MAATSEATSTQATSQANGTGDDDDNYDDDDSTPTVFDLSNCQSLSSVLEEYDYSDYVDLTGDDYSPGDLYVYDENEVYMDGLGDGVSAGRCVALQDTTDEENLYCQISFNFPEGSVEMAGIYFELAVVAGTGCFEGISGFMELSDAVDIDGDLAYEFLAEDSAPDGCFNINADTNWVQTAFVDTVDYESNGPSVGDVIVFDSNDVVSAQGTEGFMEGTCMYMSNEDLYCTMTFVIGEESDSILYAEGPFDNMIIVHGSGCYFGATGSVVGSGSYATDSEVDFKFRFDSENASSSCIPGIFDDPWVEGYDDVLVDYVGNGDEDNGNLYVYNQKPLKVSNGNGSIPAFMSGRCFLLQGNGYYCAYVANLPGGSVAFRGFWEEMSIVAGSGCYRDLVGRVFANDGDDGYEYTFEL